jgi:AcrR family transcriptional regulator
MPPSATESTRRTQEERREHTQRILLDATISSLAELGYSGTTTLEVERRAGVSRGARIHYFPSKAALLASAADKLYEQLSNHYAQAFAQAQNRRSDRQRFRAGLHLLWAIYQRPEYSAALALNVEARNDPELAERLRAVAKRHRSLALQAAQQFFPALGKTRAECCVETIQVAFAGLRMHCGVVSDERHVEMVLTALEDLVMSYLESPTKTAIG